MSRPPSAIRRVATADAVVTRLAELMDRHGDTRYDEAVTQREHALQAAALAIEAGAPDSLVVAALLHDVGHLLLDEHDGRVDFLAGDRQHEVAGARFLARWFPAEVSGPVGLHVDAKRYLVAVDSAYASTLSPASRRSLAVQGGPLTRDEVRAFETMPHADAAVRLRRWDDEGKRPGRSTPAFAGFIAVIGATIRPPRVV
jgi:phosphonate degradation associated HDIG domain protein